MNKKLSTQQQDEISNLQIGFKCLEQEMKNEADRFKTADEKANMFLVFNAAILILFTIIFPLPHYDKHQVVIVFWCIFALLCASLTSTVILIVAVIFPRSYNVLNENNYVVATFYHCSSVEFIGKIMKEHSDSLKELIKIADKKFTLLNSAMILTIVNIIMSVILVLMVNL